jgi:hypothetical protein
MKVQYNGHETFINGYEFSKRFSEYGIVKELNADARFEGVAFDELIQNTASGFNEEPVLLSRFCDQDEIEYEGFIFHNQGKFNLNRCIADKQINFKSIIDCIKGTEGNIFNYPASTTERLQGVSQRLFYSESFLYPHDNSLNNLTVDQALALVTIPDNSANGYFIESISITITQDLGGVDPDDDPDLPTDINIAVWYVRLFSPTQINSKWQLLPDTTGYFYTVFPTLIWEAKEIISSQGRFFVYRYRAGKPNLYDNGTISNTIPINNLLEDILNCTGKTLVSNWFGINEDNTNPLNPAYEYADDFCKNIKIAQSYDIIREAAIQDSFGASGDFDVEKLIKDLNNLFNLKIIYDEVNDVVRWEHITYWQSRGLDFEAKNLLYEISDQFEVNKDLVNEEVWSFAQETAREEFYSSKIVYNNRKIEDEPNIIFFKSDLFLSDVFDSLNNDKYELPAYQLLFFLLSTDGNNLIDFNEAFAMRNIVANCHYYNRPSRVGRHDGEGRTFWGFSIGLEGEVKFSSSIKMFDKLNPGNTVVINKGTFQITELKINEQNIVTLQIKK